MTTRDFEDFFSLYELGNRSLSPHTIYSWFPSSLATDMTIILVENINSYFTTGNGNKRGTDYCKIGNPSQESSLYFITLSVKLSSPWNLMWSFFSLEAVGSDIHVLFSSSQIKLFFISSALLVLPSSVTAHMWTYFSSGVLIYQQWLQTRGSGPTGLTVFSWPLCELTCCDLCTQLLTVRATELVILHLLFSFPPSESTSFSFL